MCLYPSIIYKSLLFHTMKANLYDYQRIMLLLYAAKHDALVVVKLDGFHCFCI